MNLRQLYDTSIRLGMALDVRGEAALHRQMSAAQAEYDALPDWQQPYFDLERTRNPFGDVRIARGPDDVELRAVLLGINIGLPELLLANALRASGRPVDAVIAHHTTGIGVAPSLVHDFMSVNAAFLESAGVPAADAARVIDAYIAEKWQAVEDYSRIGPDTATLLDFPLACIHTPADYYTTEEVRPVVEAAAPTTVLDVVRALLTIPEVQSSARIGAGPRIMSADPDRPVGRILYKFGGGYILPPEAYTLLGRAGVNTVLQIGCPPAHAATANAAGVTVIRIPHTACDNIGINLLLDAVEAVHGPLEVIPCHGFERHRRRHV
jgi:hypothetical protein